jgi:hypothetical protein
MNTVQLTKLKNAGSDAYFTSNTWNEVTAFNNYKNKISSACAAEFERCDTDFLIDYIIKTHHAFAKTNAIIIYN